MTQRQCSPPCAQITPTDKNVAPGLSGDATGSALPALIKERGDEDYRPLFVRFVTVDAHYGVRDQKGKQAIVSPKIAQFCLRQREWG